MRRTAWVAVGLLAAAVVAWGCTESTPAKTQAKSTMTVTEVKTGTMASQPAATMPAKPEAKTVADDVKTAPAGAAKPGKPAPQTVSACAAAPKIDGDLSDACWKEAKVVGQWINVYDGQKPPVETEAWICYDKDNVYIAFLNKETRMKSLVSELKDRDSNVYEEDSNELFLDPTAGKGTYFQLISNANGALYDGEGKDASWNSTTKLATKKMDDGWALEMAIPLKDLKVTGSPAGQTWTANFCRNRLTEGSAQAFAWGDTGESFHNTEGFGKLIFK